VTIEGSIQTDELKKAKIDVEQDQVTYNSNTTPPIINISSPEEKDYTNDGILTIYYKVEDSESGVADDSWRVEKDDQILDWQEKNIDLSLEHLGSYTLAVSATDQAGNSDEKEVKFQIVTNLNVIRNNLAHYFDLGLIKKKVAYKYFSRKLKNLKKLFDLLEKTKNSNLKPKPKQVAIAALEKLINANIDRIIRQVSRKSPRWVDSKAVELLIEDLNFIKIIKN